MKTKGKIQWNQSPFSITSKVIITKPSGRIGSESSLQHLPPFQKCVWKARFNRRCCKRFRSSSIYLECGLEKPAGRKHLPVFALFVIGQKGKRSQPKQMDVGSADKSVKRCKLLVKNSASHSSNGVSESQRYFCSLGMQRLFKFSFVPFFDETGAVSVEQQLQVSDVFSYLDAFVGIGIFDAVFHSFKNDCGR